MKVSKKHNIEDAALTAVAEFVRSRGWTVLVISADRIQGPIGPKYNHEVVFRFTGAAPKAKGGVK